MIRSGQGLFCGGIKQFGYFQHVLRKYLQAISSVVSEVSRMDSVFKRRDCKLGGIPETYHQKDLQRQGFLSRTQLLKKGH